MIKRDKIFSAFFVVYKNKLVLIEHSAFLWTFVFYVHSKDPLPFSWDFLQKNQRTSSHVCREALSWKEKFNLKKIRTYHTVFFHQQDSQCSCQKCSSLLVTSNLYFTKLKERLKFILCLYLIHSYVIRPIVQIMAYG